MAKKAPIRLADFQVSNHAPLVIPSAAEGSAVRLAVYFPMQKVEKIKFKMSSVVVSPVSESR